MCEYCRTRIDCDDKTFVADNPTPIIYEKSDDLLLEVNLLTDAIHFNVDCVADDDTIAWKFAYRYVNYCPMCGRKLTRENK